MIGSARWLVQIAGERAAGGIGPVAACPAMAAALRRRRIDPQLVDERELGVMFAGLEFWVPTWSWRLTPLCLWARPVDPELPPMLGPGWLLDAPARRILAGEASRGAELWIASDPIDWLTLATLWGEADPLERGVVGLVRMPWSRKLAARVPDGATLVVSSESVGAQVLRTVRDRPVSVRLWRAVPRG